MVKNSIGIPSDLRRVHRAIILSSIRSAPTGARAELARQTGLSAMAVSRIIRELIDAGLVEETGKLPTKSSPGRRQTDLRISPSGAYAIGVVISAFGHELAVFDAAGQSLAQRTLPFDAMQTAEQAIEATSKTIDALLSSAAIDIHRVLGIAIAIAAFVQPVTGTVIKAPYLGWHEIEFGRRLQIETGLPVVVENIADAMNMAEQMHGAAIGIGDVFLAHQSVTCGASYAHDGQLIRGAHFSAGQIGHIPVGETPLQCTCGNNACFNNHASGWAVLAQLGRIDSRRFEPGKIQTYAGALEHLVGSKPQQGSPEGNALFDAGYQLGLTMQSVALIVDPQAIVLTGKLSHASAYVKGCQSAWEDAPKRKGYKLPILKIGKVGALPAAGLLALQSFLFSPQLDLDRLLGYRPGISRGSLM